MGTLVALRLFLSASACSRQHVGMGSFGACTHIALRGVSGAVPFFFKPYGFSKRLIRTFG
ncbi:MAG: hypothetical protein IPK82_00035 [Polyangiaceae bacterium]|nr:hypothetical protein [Polyangiaceae bacterium]